MDASLRSATAGTPSLPEAHRTIGIPANGGWLRKFLAFAGPGYMVSVGYMDPGNWATDLGGGSRYGYTLLWVILASNLMAQLLQTLCARLGLVTGKDLAQACRDYYKRPAAIALWLLCEIAIVACDLAEVIGSAVALNLLFHVPLLWGVLITSADVLMLLGLMHSASGRWRRWSLLWSRPSGSASRWIWSSPNRHGARWFTGCLCPACRTCRRSIFRWAFSARP